jgi:hypothetical protein
MAQKYSEAQKQSARKWDAANLDRLSLALPKGSREAIKAHATAQGESTNAFIKRAIDCQMERDGAGGPQEAAGAAEVAGGISLSPDALDAAQQAAERTGEAPAVFVARAIETQAKRDKSSIALGINPATGDKLDKEAM